MKLKPLPLVSHHTFFGGWQEDRLVKCQDRSALKGRGWTRTVSDYFLNKNEGMMMEGCPGRGHRTYQQNRLQCPSLDIEKKRRFTGQDNITTYEVYYLHSMCMFKEMYDDVASITGHLPFWPRSWIQHQNSTVTLHTLSNTQRVERVLAGRMGAFIASYI